MYPEQIKIIKSFLPKFDCIQNHIVRFIRECRLPGVENKSCCSGTHQMQIGQTAYVYNGKPFGLKSVFCSDIQCFLENLDAASVNKFLESTKKKK